MKLTIEHNRETIKRYGHIKRARGRKTETCSARCPDSTRICTRERDHRGPHVAHATFGRVVSVWGSSSGSDRVGQQASRSPETGPQRRREGKRSVGLRTKSPVGLLEGLQSLVTRIGSSLEEITFLIFFLAFVAFAIGGFLLIALG